LHRRRCRRLIHRPARGWSDLDPTALPANRNVHGPRHISLQRNRSAHRILNERRRLRLLARLHVCPRRLPALEGLHRRRCRRLIHRPARGGSDLDPPALPASRYVHGPRRRRLPLCVATCGEHRAHRILHDGRRLRLLGRPILGCGLFRFARPSFELTDLDLPAGSATLNRSLPGCAVLRPILLCPILQRAPHRVLHDRSCRRLFARKQLGPCGLAALGRLHRRRRRRLR